jgi:hypothetical protein
LSSIQAFLTLFLRQQGDAPAYFSPPEPDIPMSDTKYYRASRIESGKHLLNYIAVIRKVANNYELFFPDFPTAISGRRAHAQAGGNLAFGHAGGGQPQHVADLAHG